ncbi:MAG: hypothetical protein M0036_26820 [Desulfobacteraceae bacterium]|nr:hypothetical protein [Desulfobacteraceae bacterium]
MSETIKQDQWVYVVIQNPGQHETIVGQRDTESQIDFIPVFKSRDDAQQGVMYMAKSPGQKFEIQAIIYEDLLRHAEDGGFLVFMLDGGGRVLTKIRPDGRHI